MKYRSLHIITLLSAFFIFSSDSCDSTIEERQKREKAQFHSKIETIKEGFETDYLTETARIAFEGKAKQKLIDFSDYFIMYSDKALETLFRDKAGEMILDLFDRSETTLEFKLKDSEDRIRLNPEVLMEKLRASDYDVLLMIPDSVRTYRALERINESTYSGVLSYLQSIEGITDKDTILIDVTTMQCDFYVMKIRKNIGMESKKIWQVFLGNMENINSNKD
jgi:hypothetical protein